MNTFMVGHRATVLNDDHTRQEMCL